MNKIHITVSICNEEYQSVIDGSVWKDLDATDLVDNEENCVRLAEQMVREAFKRARDKCY